MFDVYEYIDLNTCIGLYSEDVLWFCESFEMMQYSDPFEFDSLRKFQASQV